MSKTETERELIDRAQQALSSCHWTVGECAATWCQRYAAGRTDADFGALVGLSGDQIFERRRVWEVFGDVSGTYRNLTWSHFRVARTWGDGMECLQWADENQATVAEMKAWQRMQNGDDLTVDADADDDSSSAMFEESPARPESSASIGDPDIEPITPPNRDPRETPAPATGAIAPAYSTARSDEARAQREPSANEIDEQQRVRRCLSRLSTAARECSRIGDGRWFDLLRDHLDQLAEDARQHEEPNGLDKATIDAVIKST